MEQLILTGAAFVVFLVLVCWSLVLVEATKPRGHWSSATYGDADATAAQWGPELSALDVYDHPRSYEP